MLWRSLQLVIFSTLEASERYQLAQLSRFEHRFVPIASLQIIGKKNVNVKLCVLDSRVWLGVSAFPGQRTLASLLPRQRV